jgi:RNA polymerase sigma-70 factor (sigma-E family)
VGEVSDGRGRGVYEGVGAEQASFAEFYQRARDDCLRVVQASVSDRQAAEDLVAEAFARAWAAWPKVSLHPSPQAWVVRTALNTSVSFWRRHGRHVAIGSYVEPDAADPSADSGAVEADLMAALRGLPIRQRQVIALRIFLDLDTARTAEVLGIAPGTVTAHLSRAIATLRELVPTTKKRTC